MSRKYDFLIVGAGLSGATAARLLTDAGKRCLLVEKSPHIAGNLYTETIEGIPTHMYGAHIFHTSLPHVWSYVNRFAEFNGFINSPLANYRGELYNLPFNMNTFHAMWGVMSPAEARQMIAEQVAEAGITEPKNLEEQALMSVGRDIYEKLIKGYTEKQWGRDCKDLPASIIKRIPVRFTYDNNYFNDRYQGIPIGGYTPMLEKMLAGIEVRTDVDFFGDREHLRGLADKLIYTGPIDRYFGYCCGALAWRSLRFETEVLDIEDFQGVAAVNYTDRAVPYTRICEHKHFESLGGAKTVITREYPAAWEPGAEPYYPINDEENNAVFARYKTLAQEEKGVYFGGRLADYAYYDMDKTVAAALTLAEGCLREA